MKKFFKLYKIDILLLVILCIISIIPRFILLDSIPPGLHGDEAWTGIDAKKLISQGQIEPYVSDELGTPTGSFLLPALIISFIGDSVFWVRSSFAIQGVISILLFYIFLRLFFNKKVSFLTSLALSLSLYHIHYSRTAFVMMNALPLQLSTLILIFGDFKKKILTYSLAGIACGVGMYSYNVYPLFPFSIFLYLTIKVLFSKHKKNELLRFISFILFFIITSAPLILFISRNSEFYFSHYIIVSKPTIQKQADSLEKFTLATREYTLRLHDFFMGYRIDYVDAYGYSQSFNYLYLICASLGIIFVIRKRDRASLFFLISFIIMLMPLILTEFTYRRQILILPYLYYFFALTISLFEQKYLKYNLFVSGFFIVIITAASCFNIYRYFFVFPNIQPTNYTFPFAETQASIILKKITQPNGRILFFSDRMSCHYETVRYLTNNHPCEDRSTAFGGFSIDAGNNKNVIFALFSNYINHITEIKTKYPNGNEYFIKDHNNTIVGILYKI